MTNLAHIAETTLLLLAAYLLGCGLGYAIRLILHAGRGTRQVPAPLPPMAPVSPPPEPRRTLTPAARLAARVEDIPPPPPVIRPPVTLRVEPAPPLAKPPAKSGAKPKSAESKPATLALARDGQPDNLKQIKGIGPKIEASLYALGIFHIDQIASWSARDVEWVGAQLAFKGRIRRERWVEQAAALNKANA